MIRMYLLMAALCQLMACSTVPTEAKVPELGSEVDSASCEGLRNDYALIMDKMEVDGNVDHVARKFIKWTLQPLSSSDAIARCFTKDELAKLYAAERDIYLRELESDLRDWSRYCSNREVLENLSFLTEPAWESDDHSLIVVLEPVDLDRVMTIKAYGLARCTSSRQPDVFEDGLMLAALIENRLLRAEVSLDIVEHFYRAHYTVESKDPAATERMLSAYPLNDLLDPKALAINMIQSGNPPDFQIYEDWDVDYSDMDTTVTVAFTNKSIDTRNIANKFLNAGYPRTQVLTLTFNAHMDRGEHRSAAWIGREHLGPLQVEMAENAYITWADESLNYSIAVDRHGNKSRTYNWNR
ncbi:hypothetical protein HOI18_04180 [Candidatus Uhrbacteria bacterium]|nr:hypothetical protein [Candidatus Uhrbacteria bacterium]